MSDTPETDSIQWEDSEWDLKERFKKLERERDECKKLSFEQHLHIEELDKENGNQFELIAKLIEERDTYWKQSDYLLEELGKAQERMIDAERERDGWREAAYSLGEAIPASWEELQPPAAQLAKFKEMVQLQQEKYKL